MDVISQAKAYAARGWSVVPIAAGSKGPTRAGWQNLRLSVGEIDDLFHGGENVGIILGQASGGLLNVDLDCVEAVALAAKYLPATPCVSGREGRPGSHWWYKCSDCTPKQFRDPETKGSIVEIRGDGQQTVVGPSKHPTGDIYQAVPLHEPATVERSVIEAAVEELWKAVVAHRGHAPKSQPVASRGPMSVEDRALAYLDSMPPAIQGQNGSGALYAAATSLIHGFELSEDLAAIVLLERYNPRCVPPWSVKEIEHKCHEAATKAHRQPRGWLKNAANPNAVDYSGVDISGLLGAPAKLQGATKKPQQQVSIPHHLFEAVPGFIRQVMDVTLAAAKYPNLQLAFAGAVCLQSHLCARKVRDETDCRTNLYVLGLGDSGIGKDAPRKTNKIILAEAGINSHGDSVASGESLQDWIVKHPSLLLMTDEIDGMFESIKTGAESRFASWQKIVMSLWSSSNSEFTRRLKSNEDQVSVSQPHLTILGNAVTSHFLGAMTESQLTSGLMSRLLFVEAGSKRVGAEHGGRPVVVPPAVVEVAKWWKDFSPGGDLSAVNPQPITIGYTEEARRTRQSASRGFEKAYDNSKSDAERAVWSRACEQAQRLALCYACSENHKSPTVTTNAIEWAVEFMTAHAERLLHLAAVQVTDSAWDKTAKKVLRKIEDAELIEHSALLRMCNMPSKSLREITDTLVASERIRPVQADGKVFWEVVG